MILAKELIFKIRWEIFSEVGCTLPVTQDKNLDILDFVCLSKQCTPVEKAFCMKLFVVRT